MLAVLQQKQLEHQAIALHVDASEPDVRTFERELIPQSFTIAAVTVQQRYTIHRERWTYRRTGRWFEETLPHLDEWHFRLCFRVSPSTFRYLVDVCRPAMESEVR